MKHKKHLRKQTDPSSSSTTESEVDQNKDDIEVSEEEQGKDEKNEGRGGQDNEEEVREENYFKLEQQG